jgi:hypothetical protein
MHSRTPVLILASTCLLAVLAPAQCTVANVAFTAYGAGCNTVFAGTPPALSGQWDPTSCTLSVTLSGFSGCCNTFLQQRILWAGLAPAQQPLPFIGPGCTLLAQPDVIAMFPTAAGNTFSFTLPPGFPAVTFYMQGANQYFTTIGLTTDFELSQGLQIDVS